MLDTLAEEIQEKENIVDHLNAQRDTLLENYIKAQKLGMIMCQNQQKHSQHQALMRWSDEAKFRRNY
jgi:hypothetical protein